ncbi:hypothetical protein [Psychrobacter sp. 72-O-c]|uniref:hypothetical protein n=1 Tax=Psychrobacter sp. 72-O-c TaxID=2774125 RepID=UPI001917EB59|nr:hypothetical protein [Psychrobacter sp. 72-O-c]
MRKTINYFMWGYQNHFRFSLKYNTEKVLEKIGLYDVDFEVLLVGVLASDFENNYPICIEPEDGKWDLKIFGSLIEDVKKEIENHPLKNMFYSNDELAMREKPENIRRDSISRAVRKSLLLYDNDNDIESFVGFSTLVEGYYVVPVIQVPKEIFQKHPSLDKKNFQNKNLSQGYSSFIEAVLKTLLEDASKLLQTENPGRGRSSIEVREVVRSAADSFLYTPSIAIYEKYAFTNLFETLNLISSLFYEGVHSLGKMIISDPKHASIIFSLEFQDPVPINNIRWVRKVLEMSSNTFSLIADNEYIYGLGSLVKDYDFFDQKIFIVEFLDHYYWQISCGDIILLQSQYNEPRLYSSTGQEELLLDNLNRLYPYTTHTEKQNILNLVLTLTNLNRGSMLVIADDAETEVKRLARLGTPIKPVLLTPDLLEQVSGIDGTVIINPKGVCFGIGIILDGDAMSECTPSRGSRYNSGVRYVYPTKNKKRLAVIVSDDKTVDIVPRLRPMISLSEIEHNISLLEHATLEDLNQPRNWIDDNRFYFNEEQCVRVNKALDRIESLTSEVGQIRFITQRLSPNKDMDSSYLTE